MVNVMNITIRGAYVQFCSRNSVLNEVDDIFDGDIPPVAQVYEIVDKCVDEKFDAAWVAASCNAKDLGEIAMKA